MKKTSLVLAVAMAMSANAAQAENLLDVYRLALASDPQVKAAEASWQAVQETRQQSRALFHPKISLDGNAARNRQEVVSSSSLLFPSGSTFYFTTKSLSLNLNQPLYRRDYYIQLRQSDARIRQAEAEYRAAQQGLLLRVSEHYFTVLAEADTLGFAQAEKQAIARQLEQIRQRFEVGLVAITDVHEAQARFDLASSQEIEAQTRLASSREALREMTATLPATLSGLTDTVPLVSPEPQNAEAWVNTARNQNFQIIAAEAATDVAAQNIAAQRAGHHPTLDAVLSHGYGSSGGAFGNRETLDSAIGVQLSVPLYSGGAVNSRVREAQHRLTQSKQVLEQQQRTAVRQTRDSYMNVLASISRISALRQATVSSQSALDATQAGAEVGTRTTVDVLNAQRDVYRAQRDLSRARYDYVLNMVRLKQAAGMLSLADLEQVNGWLQDGPSSP